MSAWVSRESLDKKDLDQSGKAKRKREKMGVGVRGVKESDKFIVMWLDPDRQLRQERIKLLGKPGKKLADRRAEQITASLTLGTYEDKNTARWDSVRKEFESKFVSEKSAATQAMYKETLDLLETLCKPAMIRSITNKTVDDFRTGLRDRRGRKKGTKNSAANINKHLRHLRRALRWAYKREYLKKLPEIEFVREPEKEPVYMTPEHFQDIYQHCDSARYPAGGDRPYTTADWWRALMVTGIMTGMRITEMLMLPWEDVHLDNGYLVVRHGIAKAKRDDTIPLHPFAIDHLRKLIDLGETFVFNWPLGKRALFDEWHRIQRAAGIDLPCNETHEHTDACHAYGFHSLKKACGTLNAAKLPEAVLNAFMRHATIETTRKYYRNKKGILEGWTDSMYVPEVNKDSG